jgi:hypothetical protein
MLPHLFVNERSPAVRLAALGDLGGAIGASPLVAAPQPSRRSAERRGRQRPGRSSSR